MNIIQSIKTSMETFSKNEQLIGTFIMNNPKSVENYTITKIAELTKTSTSAVLRFCQKLGFKGYSEFRYEMVRNINSDLSVDNCEKKDPLFRIIQFFQDSLQDFNTLERQSISDLALAIDQASQVFSCGIYKSGTVAHKLKYNLVDCGKSVIFINDLVTLSHSEFISDDKSLYIFFSISGSGADVQEYFKNNRDNLSNSYLITCNKAPKLKKYFKHTIIIPTQQSIGNIHLDEHALMFVFIEILTNYYLIHKNN